MTTIALIDDDKKFCDSLTRLINDFEDFTVCWSLPDGLHAIKQLEQDLTAPDILLLGIVKDQPSMIDVAKWIVENRKSIKVLALCIKEDDINVLQMLRYGVKGYLLKSIGAKDLQTALQQVVKTGYYYEPVTSGNTYNPINKKSTTSRAPLLTERQQQMLQFLCSEMDYTTIADKMTLSESIVFKYRARVFEKFGVKNRIGLMIKAAALGMVKL